MVNIVNVSYLISFAEGKERDVDKERRNFRFLRGRNSSLERGSACFLMKGSPAGAQSFATVPLWLQEPLLYRLAGAIIGACKKKGETRKMRGKNKRKERIARMRTRRVLCTNYQLLGSCIHLNMCTWTIRASNGLLSASLAEFSTNIAINNRAVRDEIQFCWNISKRWIGTRVTSCTNNNNLERIE